MSNVDLKRTTSGIRIILYVASFLVLAVGVSLYLLSERTDVYFSWTINPPLTAVFLGAGYLASFVLEFLSARERVWANARPAIPGVLAFTVLTSIVTFIHLDRFHFASPLLITRAGTWFWLAIYVSVPVAMGIAWALQMRKPGVDPAREARLPGWMRAILVVQGAVMFLFGGALLLFPKVALSFWPWKLSPLTSQAIGAWGVSIGFIACQAAWEDDWERIRAMIVSYALYGGLQVIGLLRYPATLDWTDAASGAYAIFACSVFLVGAYGAWAAWRKG